MKQQGFFDDQICYERLDKTTDPLLRLKGSIDWELFRPELEAFRNSSSESNAGRKPFDPILMFKILVLQALYNLSDDAMEFQIRDRLSFMRFLDLSLNDRIPDAKTIWLFRENLGKANLIKSLFEKFDSYLTENGFAAKKGQIVDASIVKVPTMRNSREENRMIKEGHTPEKWSDNKRRQKDTDARWTKKRGSSYFGYKNHISVDVKHKLIRKYEVTEASVHDSQIFEEILDRENSSRDVYADSAYRSEDQIARLKEAGYREHIQRKGYRNNKLTWWERQGNRTRSRIRSRIEHVFGVQAQTAKDVIVRGIGKVRAAVRIGLRNLSYNMNRYAFLSQTG